jgi:hypothetical protein
VEAGWKAKGKSGGPWMALVQALLQPRRGQATPFAMLRGTGEAGARVPSRAVPAAAAELEVGALQPPWAPASLGRAAAPFSTPWA